MKDALAKACLVLALVGPMSVLTDSACAPKVPATYSVQSQRAANAQQLLQALTGLSQTAINLNALPSGSTGRLSDADTAVIRDVVLLVSGDPTTQYVSTGATAEITNGLNDLTTKLSTDARVNAPIKAALAIINTNVQLLLGSH